MTPGRVRASLIVRVVDGRSGRRIVVHDLRRREVRAFSSWAAAIAYLQGAADASGLR